MSRGDASFGSSVALARVNADTDLIAVGAPDAGHVWLYRAAKRYRPGNPSVAWEDRSCSVARWRQVALTPTRSGDLVISDAENVWVFDGLALSTLPATTSEACGLAGLPEKALLGTFGCGTDGNISGCDQSDFGVSLAVGDFDGNRNGDIAVGAPGMTVRGVDNAGAVLIYGRQPRPPADAERYQVPLVGGGGGPPRHLRGGAADRGTKHCRCWRAGGEQDRAVLLLPRRSRQQSV